MPSSASDWIKGISLSILASIIGGASKLAIRKSWIIEDSLQEENDTETNKNTNGMEMTSTSHQRNTNHKSCSPPIRKEKYFMENKQPERIRNTISYNNIQSLKKSKYLRWVGMIGMSILNPLCCVLAMNYASPSILAPFSGLTLVWIILFSPMIVNETPYRSQKIASILIVLGEVVIAISGDHTNNEYESLEDVLRSYRNLDFVIYFILLVLWMCLLFYFTRFSEGLRRFGYGAAGGSITGLQNFLKDGLTILHSSEDVPYQLYIFIVLAGGTAFAGLLLLVQCMKRYDATYSSSMFVGSFVISATIMSAIHYNTFDNLDTWWNYIFYPLGILILVIGILILGKDKEASEEHQITLGLRKEEATMVRDEITSGCTCVDDINIDMNCGIGSFDTDYSMNSSCDFVVLEK